MAKEISTAFYQFDIYVDWKAVRSYWLTTLLLATGGKFLSHK